MRPDLLTDNQVMMKVKSGDTADLGILFERYHRMLFRFFYRLNQNAVISEDLVQNVFERILRYRHRFRGDGEFKAWLFQIARNVNYDQVRKKGNRPQETIEDWQDHIIDQSPDQQALMMKKEELDLLQQSLQNLDPEKREIIVLSKLQGLKYRKIGELLGLTEGAVKVKVFRALKALKAEVAKSKSNHD